MMDAFEDRPARTSIAVGLMTLAVLAGLAAVIGFFLEKESPFARSWPVYVDFADVAGLKPGAPVTLMGASIGRVDGIRLAPAAAGRGARWQVALALRDEPWIHDAITTRTSFAVQPESLFGNKYVNASFGEGGAPLQAAASVDGTVAAGVDARTFEKLSSALENLSGAAADLRALLAPPTATAGAAGVTATAAPNLREAMANLDVTLRNASEATTALKEALSAENQAKMKQTFDDISKSAANLSNVTERMKAGMDSWADTMEKMRFWKGWFKDEKKDKEKTNGGGGETR
jgi:ABC-type transporter Mla subunit MlaD